jgi:thiamine pyrophosphate-dependent acetolactate synthase large subunit-like protein
MWRRGADALVRGRPPGRPAVQITMRELIRDYLAGSDSRRAFIRKSLAAGFTAAAAQSAANAMQALSPKERAANTTPYTGTGGDLLAEQFIAAGIRFVFVCNSSGMGPLCDAMIDRPQLQFIQAVCENHTVSMADGFAKATGHSGVACFSRVGGPLASANMYNAMKDRTPVVIVTDHADSQEDGRDGHEDIDDWLEPFKQYTKWRWLVKEGNRIPEWTAHAFKLANTAPGGPAFLRIPRNVMYQRNLKADIFSGKSINVPMKLSPNPALIEEAARYLIEAKSPLLYVGSEVWTSGGRADVVRLAELLAIPVTQAWSWAADFPTDHPLYLGGYFSPMRYPKDIDVFVNLGANMPDQRSGPPLVPRSARIVHGRIASQQIGVNYPVDVPIVADVKETARALTDAVRSMLTKERLESIRQARWDATRHFTQGLRESYLTAVRDGWDDAPLTWPRLLLGLNEVLEQDAVIVEELGTEDWVLRSFSFADGKKTKIGRTLGRSLCWGVGASIGVKLAWPDRQVVSLQGDGGFLFGQSDALWTMSRYDVPVITVICNNRSYDEPRNNMLMKGGRLRQTNRDMICYLGSPDVEFTHIAAAHGIKAERVENPAQLGPALQRAIATTRDGRPYLLDVRIERTGLGADWTSYPRYSLAAARTRKV